MWPFTRKNPEADERLREIFGRYVSADVLDIALAEFGQQPQPPQTWRGAYILLQVRDRDLDAVSGHLDSAIEILTRRGGFVTDLMSSLVLATFGLPLVDDDLGKARSQQTKAVVRLISELGQNIRLVYGTAECLAGNVGASKHMNFGILLPDVAGKLSALLALEFGKSAEA
jgi:hypothetical protein